MARVGWRRSPGRRMHDTQYALFQELDRRCVAGGFQETDCRESVRLKRASIELEESRGNPVVRDVLAGRTTLVAEYDRFSRMFRGVRRFLPKSHSAACNERLRNLAKVVPNVRHFTRRSLLAIDNPVTAGFYGFVASMALLVVLSLVLRAEDDAASLAAGWTGGWLSLGFTAVGVLAGSLAMLRYRTRDAKEIHAREAAAYMDVNYEFYGLNNDRAWAEYIRQQGGAGASRIVMARPDERG